MAKIVRAVAFANNEVAFMAWKIDEGYIPGCLGFHVVREYRFRAVEAELSKKKGSSATSKRFDGFLGATDGWQTSSSHRLSRYFTEAVP